MNGDFKRRRLDNNQTSFSRTPPYSPISPYPDKPLLYHLAIQAHHAARNHLQQVFIPSTVITTEASTSIKCTRPDTTGSQTFTHDSQAPEKAVGLLLLALQILKIGLEAKDLSDVERVAFSYEFGLVGVKILDTYRLRSSVKGKQKALARGIDVDKIKDDVQVTLASGVS